MLVTPQPVYVPVTKPLKDKIDLKPNVSDKLKYVYDAITLTRKEINGQCPLFGFTGAPWTLMAYMIEGGGSNTHSKAKKWLYQHPEKSRELLDALVEICIGLVSLFLGSFLPKILFYDFVARYTSGFMIKRPTSGFRVALIKLLTPPKFDLHT